MTNSQLDRLQDNKQTDRQLYRSTDRQVNRLQDNRLQDNRLQDNRQTDRQVDRKIEKRYIDK